MIVTGKAAVNPLNGASFTGDAILRERRDSYFQKRVQTHRVATRFMVPSRI